MGRAAVILVCVVAAACSAGQPEAPTPARLLLVGDSVMEQVASGVEAGADARVDFVLTIGAANVEDDWWDVWPRAVREHRPDLVAVLVGPWEIDRPDLGTAAWRRWYADRLDRWADLLTAGGARLLWVQPPAVRDPVNEPRFDHVREAYAALARRRADTEVVEALPGPYRPFAAGERLRRIDGLHLCPAGVAAAAERLLEAAGLPAPPAGWREGAWTRRAPAYDPVECPPSA